MNTCPSHEQLADSGAHSGSQERQVAGGWRRLCNEELQHLCTSRNTIMMINSRSTRLVGHVAHMGDVRNQSNILFETPKQKRLR